MSIYYNDSMTNDVIMSDLLKYAHTIMDNNDAYPFAAYIVKNGEIISRGYNKKVQLYGDKTTHGEMEAINAAIEVLHPKKIVILDDGYELFSTCEPCLACFDTALWANIRKFVFCVDHHDFPDYFHDHPYTIEQYELEHPQAIEVIRNMHHDDGLTLFDTAKQKYGW